MTQPDRPSRFSLPPPMALREEAKRVGRRVARVGRPRRRFLTQQRVHLVRGLMPVLGITAAGAALLAVLDVLGLSWPRATPGEVAVPAAATALLLGGCTLGAWLVRKQLAPLVVLSVVGPCLTLAGAAWVVRASGGDASPFALLVVLVGAGSMGFVTLSVRAAVIVAVATALAALASGAHALPAVGLVVVICAGGVLAARVRHKRALEAFVRIERQGAALERLRSLQEQLVVVEKLEALRVLVGGMAHELNNALAISVASNQQATRELPPGAEGSRAALGRSDGGLMRIRRTVDRLRRFAMAEGAVLEAADVGAMLDFALESAIGRARSGVIVERAYDPGVGAIEIHVAALAEALFQVARNAVEAMPGGGTIQARVRREADRVVLSVSDQGKGIPAEEIARVFDPFYTRTKNKSGLGLSAVYGLVSALGGRVELRSEVGRGTEVAIVLPARKAQSMRPTVG